MAILKLEIEVESKYEKGDIVLVSRDDGELIIIGSIEDIKLIKYMDVMSLIYIIGCLDLVLIIQKK